MGVPLVISYSVKDPGSDLVRTWFLPHVPDLRNMCAGRCLLPARVAATLEGNEELSSFRLVIQDR